MMLFTLLAVLCAGLFAVAAIYITAVEHPARLACGPTIAIKAFAPSYHRAAIMQASLAVVGSVAGVAAWRQIGSGWLLTGSLLLGSVVPFTLLVMLPTNKRLMDPTLAAETPEAALLLARWGWLHAVRSLASAVAFVLLLLGLAAR
jgi:uncharacterized membrane protein